jgi:hypothetical protein
MSVKGYVSVYEDVPARAVLRGKEGKASSIYGYVGGFTFLGQFQPELAMRIGQLPMLAHQVMVHVGACVVHTLQRY